MGVSLLLMAYEQQQNQALHLLQGIENGTLDPSQAAHLIAETDPALVYFLFTWLRKRYGADHPAAEGVIGRLVQLSATAEVKSKMAEGKSDPLVEWFEDEYSYRDLSAEELVRVVIEKIEG